MAATAAAAALDEQGSIYSFTSYNTSHYSSSDLTNRSQLKVNSYAIEMNQKVKEDNQSLNEMEEGMNALSNFLNGIEEKRPSVTELIGSRINLEDCLKLKFEIRERIRKTKQIRTDLFTTVRPHSPHSPPALPLSSHDPSSSSSNISPRVFLSPQTSRITTLGHQHSEGENLHLTQPKVRKPKPKMIETSKSFSSLPPSAPVTPIQVTPLKKAESSKTSQATPSQSFQEYSQDKRTSQSNSNEISNDQRYPQPNDSLPSVKQPLITPLIPSSAQRNQKYLIPADDLADRQLAWLLNIEAKNRQAKQALEAQIIREVIYFPSPSSPQLFVVSFFAFLLAQSCS